MPREVTTKAYGIKELEGKAREKAIEVHRQMLNESPWLLEGWRELCIEELEERGFELRVDYEKNEYKSQCQKCRRWNYQVVSEKNKICGYGDCGGELKNATKPTRESKRFYYSLSYSQGDGVAMYGRIDVLKWLAWIAKATEETVGKDRAEPDAERRWAQDQIDNIKLIFGSQLTSDTIDGKVYYSNYPVIAVTENSLANHYSHYNTMDFEWEDEFYNLLKDGWLPSDEDYVPDGVNPSPRDVEIKKLEDFQKELLDWVTTGVRDLSKRFTRDGYAEMEYQLEDAQVIEDAEANDAEFTAEGRRFPL